MSTLTITNQLFEEYFQQNNTPSTLVSSYWKEMHQHSTVQRGRDGIIQAKGVGFGDFEYNKFYHRTFAWMTILAHLAFLPDRLKIIAHMFKARAVLKRQGFFFCTDAFRFVCTMELLSRYLPKDRRFRVINIGDGYGFLSALIKECYPQAQLCMVDLGKTLFFQAKYCGKAFPDKKHFLVKKGISPADIDKDADFIFCPAENLSTLNDLTFDAAINICSMQEMNISIVSNYFSFPRKHMTKDNIFYCCNRIEKILEGGEVLRFHEFPWNAEDRHLFESQCLWNQFYLAAHQEPQGPKLFNLRIPFVNYYAGPIQHRVTAMKIW